jgi:hypothetical protein
VQTVTGGTDYIFLDTEQWESNLLWTDYQLKLSLETVIVYVASDGQVIKSPTTIMCQVKSGKSISVPHILGTITL